MLCWLPEGLAGVVPGVCPQATLQSNAMEIRTTIR
jgi:hypothetical protein